MNLGTSRKIVILAVALLAGHVLVLALHRALLSNLVELALAAVTAAAAYQTAQRARGFARRFWRLIAVSFTIYTLGQVFYTYYDSILHASPLIWWPSDALLLFYVAPMVMTLFLGDDSAERAPFPVSASSTSCKSALSRCPLICSSSMSPGSRADRCKRRRC